jgi:hypothetical protein
MSPSMLLFFMIVVSIPIIIGVGGDVLKRWIKLKEKQLDNAAVTAAEKAATQVSHIERLEQRMRVLERIATDKGVDLAAQIDALRDDRIN